MSKAWLDGWIEAGGYRRFANDGAGIAELAGWVAGHGGGLVVMEASGGIEQAAFLALWRAGLPCALTNPRTVRRFAEAMGRLEKTDRIDAEVIARHAEARGRQLVQRHADDPKIRPPRADFIRVLAGEHPRNLDDVIEIVRSLACGEYGIDAAEHFLQ